MLTFFPYDEALIAVRNACGQKNTAITKILQFLTGSAGYCRLTGIMVKILLLQNNKT